MTLFEMTTTIYARFQLLLTKVPRMMLWVGQQRAGLSTPQALWSGVIRKGPVQYYRKVSGARSASGPYLGLPEDQCWCTRGSARFGLHVLFPSLLSALFARTWGA